MDFTPQIAPGTPVLVTGATGFTGSLLVRRLVEAGVRVRALARPSSSTEHLKDLEIEWFTGHIYEPDTVNAAVDGTAYIFHLAAVYRQTNIPDELFHRIHVEGTKCVAEAARRNTALQRLVHVSTIGVHGHVRNPPADEQAPFNPDDRYQATKAEAEQWVRAYATEHGVPHTILRPCAIYGPGDTRLLKVFRMASRRYCPILGQRDCHYHLIHVEDLVRVILLAATRPAALNEVFIAGNPESVTMERMIRIIAGALNHSVRIIRLPAWPFFAVAVVCETVCRPLGIEPPIHRRRVAFYTKTRDFDTRKLRHTLQYEMQYTNEEGLAETARWYADHGMLRV